MMGKAGRAPCGLSLTTILPIIVCMSPKEPKEERSADKAEEGERVARRASSS